MKESGQANKSSNSPFKKYLRLVSYEGGDRANKALLAIDDPKINFLRAMRHKDPYAHIKLQSFEEFKVRFLGQNHQTFGLAFRGQPGVWSLRTKLARYLDGFNTIHDSFVFPGPQRDAKTISDTILERLKALIETESKTRDPDGDFLWAMLQHYGGASPLLDWTLSLAIALFFAFETLPTAGQDSVELFIADIGKVHAMNFLAVNNEMPTADHINETDYEVFEESWSFVWPREFGDIRFPMQQSVFLIEGQYAYSTEAKTFDQFIKNPPAHKKKYAPLPGTLLRITLPSTERAGVMNYLAEKGVTRDRLFMSWDSVVKVLMSDLTNDLLDRNYMWKYNKTIDEAIAMVTPNDMAT